MQGLYLAWRDEVGVNETSRDDVTRSSDFREGGDREGLGCFATEREGGRLVEGGGAPKMESSGLNEIQPQDVSKDHVLKGDALCSGCIFAR